MDNSSDKMKSASNYAFDNKILDFRHSFGYDSKRLSNLCLISPDVLVFASGNFIHFFNINTNEIRTQKTVNGGGIGYITKNPNPIYNHLTIAENGANAAIYIYKFPEMEIVSKCEQEDTTEYSCIDFNPDGSMMVSQTGPPRFYITIWNWQNGSIILNTKSTKNIVFRVMFSLYDPNQLTTSGQGHIQFWKISETFSGLKLKSHIGRFGKTKISDISAIYAMSNGHVLSGSEWGNILVWEEGLIKFEVCRKDRSTCHASPITQIEFQDGDVMTVGMDGYVRIWFWETVTMADPPDTDPFVPIEPTYEFLIGDWDVKCSLMALVKIDPDENWWYAQDGNGGIWKCDLSLVNNATPAERLFRSHSGKIIGIGVCPYETMIATLSQDGRLHFYDYRTNELIMWKRFFSEGRCLIWPHTDINPSGRVLILGFADGVIRVVVVDLEKSDVSEPIRLIQTIKPHKSDVTRMSINNGKTVLISGSTDQTIFVFKIEKQPPNLSLQPVGFITTPSSVTAFDWKLNSFATALVGCQHGDVLQFIIKEEHLGHDTSQSYRLNDIEINQLKFKSVKSQIQRDRKLAQIKKRKADKRLMKTQKLKEFRQENPDVRLDEEAFLEDSDSDEEVEPLYIPKVGNPILWIKYTNANTIWMTVGKYDSGYVYEYDIHKKDPVHCIELKNANDLEINSYLQINDFLIFGMSNGALRIHKIHQDFRNLSNYFELNLHDNMNGVINQITSSLDVIFTVGNDSNIFTFKNNIPGATKTSTPKTAPSISMESFNIVEDISDPESPTLEEEKVQHNLDIINQIANINKEKMKKIISEYKAEFEEIVQGNSLLPKSMQLNLKTINLDDRITADIQKILDEEMELVERKKAYEVEKSKILAKKVQDFYIRPLEELPFEIHGIRSNIAIKSFRIYKIREELTTQKNPYEREAGADDDADENVLESRRSLIPTSDEDSIMDFLNDFQDKNSDLKFELQMKRLWNKYCKRKMNEKDKSKEWSNMIAIMPDLENNAPEDVEELKQAESQIGDYKLKRDSVYVENIENRTTTADKFQELLNCRKQIDSIQQDYNQKLHKLRDEKQKLVLYTQEKLHELSKIHLSLQPKMRKSILFIPEMVEDREYPHKIFEDLENFESTLSAAVPVTNSTSVKKEINVSNILDFQNMSSIKEKTSWEYQLCQLKQIEMEFRQNQIIEAIDTRINQFDEDLSELKLCRLQVETDLKYLEIHLICLNQELCIVKDFERIENHLINQVENGERQYKDIMKAMEELNQEIVNHNKKIKSNNELMVNITQQFSGSVANNKYTKFLTKVFKKKQPIEKIEGDDEEDEDSSDTSESSSSEDETSLNSKTDIGALYFDENVCPKDCDRSLYDLTMKLRSRRHSLEAINRSSLLEIENIKKTITASNRKLGEHEKQLVIFRAELVASMKEKQNMINEVDHLVILKMNQMQYFTNKEELLAVDKSIVFDISVFNKLFARVGELELETIESKRKHRVNIIHLARMNTDCKFMEELICDLNRDYRQAMIKKFGMEINLDELQQTILNRFAFMIRSTFEDIKKEYAKKVEELKVDLSERKAELELQTLKVIEKLNILTVLEEDKNYMNSLLLSQKNQEKLRNSRPPLDVKQDVAKLQEISQQQLQTISSLEKEIYTLRLKAKPFGGMDQEIVKTQVTSEVNGYDDCTCNTKSSTSTAQMNNKAIIFQSVSKFFGKKSTKDYKQKDIEQISQHLFESIQSLNFDEMEESIAALVENFQKCLPRHWYDKFTATQIALFIQDVFRKVNLFHDRNDFEPEELIYGIVQDVRDSISPTIPDYGYKFYLELFKNLLHNMTIEDLLSNDVLSLLITILLDYVGAISLSNEIETKIFTSLVDSLIISSNDDIDIASLKQLTDYVFTSLRNKRK